MSFIIALIEIIIFQTQIPNKIYSFIADGGIIKSTDSFEKPSQVRGDNYWVIKMELNENRVVNIEFVYEAVP